MSGAGTALALALAASSPAAEMVLEAPEPRPRRSLEFLSRHPVAYASRREVPRELLLGDLLFHSPGILGGKARALGISCNTCHANGAVNKAFFIAGLSSGPGSVDPTTAFFGGSTENGAHDPRDIPSLRGARFAAPYGRQGTVASLREFTRHVIVREFAGPEPPPHFLDALVRYQAEFEFLPNPHLGPDGRLRPEAPQAAWRGEAVFHRAGCAACHAPSSHFTDGRRHRVGSGTTSSPWGLENAFKTPTLLGIAGTAPYLHDGSLASLAEVAAWFDREQGLGLSAQELADLTAYLEAVGYEEKPIEDERPNQRLSRPAFYLDLLKAEKNPALWRLALETAAAEFERLAPLFAQSSRPRVESWARRLKALRGPAARERWPEAGRKLEAFIVEFEAEIERL